MKNWPALCIAYSALLALWRAPTAPAQEVDVSARAIVQSHAHSGKNSDNANVVLWLSPLSGAFSPETLSQSKSNSNRYRLVQRRKRFEPHLLVVPVGSRVEFPNLDPFFHNVFSLFEGKRFDLGLYEAGAIRPTIFDRPGVSYIFCNIHAEMSAVVVTVNTPYFGVSNPAGEITIRNVLPGRYWLRVWKETSLPDALEGLTREVTVSETNRSLGTFRLEEAASLALVHKNMYGRDYEPPTPPSPLYNQP